MDALPLLCALWAVPVLPPVVEEDLARFPPRPEVVAARTFNRAYLAHLRVVQSVDRTHYFDYWPLIADAECRYRCWDELDDAQMTAKVPLRWHLERLRELIGPEAYLEGRMPDPAPFWLFREIP